MDTTRQREPRAATIAIWAVALLVSYELAYAHTIRRFFTDDPWRSFSSPTPVWSAIVALAPLAIMYAVGRRFERARSATQLALCVSILFLPFNSVDVDIWLSTREVFATHRGCVSYNFSVEDLLPKALVNAFVAMREPLGLRYYWSLIPISAALSAVGLAVLWRYAKARHAITITVALVSLVCAVFAAENSISRPQPGAWIPELPSVAHIVVASISADSRSPTRVGTYHVTSSVYGDGLVQVEFGDFKAVAMNDRYYRSTVRCDIRGAIEVRRLSQKRYAARCIDSSRVHGWTGVGIGDGWGELWRAHVARRIAPPIEWSIFAFAGLGLGALFAFGLRRASRVTKRAHVEPASTPYRSYEHTKPDPLRAPANTRALDQLAILTMVLHACWPVVLWALVQRYFPQL